MKRIEKDNMETTITVGEYLDLAPAVPSPTWVSVHGTGSARMLAHAIVYVVIAAALILGALR